MSVKQDLQKLIAEVQQRKFNEEQGKKLTDTYGKQIVEQLLPAFEQHSKIIVDRVSEAVKAPTVNIPPQQMPDIPAPVVNIPAPVVNVPAPVVNVPAPIVNIPETKFPEPLPFPTEFSLRGVDKMNPMPVMMVDQKGKPAQWPISMGASGGKADFFTLLGIQQSIAVVTVNPDGLPFYSSSASASNTSTQLIDSSSNVYSAANPLPVTFTGSSSTNVSFVNSDGTYYNSDNPLPTTATLSLPSGQGDAASATRVVIAGNSDASVVVNSGTITAVTNITNSVAAALVDSSGVQYSGSNTLPTEAHLHALDPTSAWEQIRSGDGVAVGAVRVVQANDSVVSTVVNSGTITAVTNITNSVAVVNLDRDGNPVTAWQIYPTSTGLNTTDANTLKVAMMTDVVSSSNIVTFNGNAPAQGLNETTAGVLRVIGMTSAVDSVNVVTLNGNAPATGLNETTSGVLRTVTMSDTASSSQSKLIATTTLPTAASDGTSTFQRSDKYGREINRPIQVRDLIATAFVQLTTGTEATLLAASAGHQYDLVWILLSNESTAAVQVDLRGVTAGNKMMSFQVPANGTVGIAPPVPLPNSSGDTGNNWTVDMPDITGTTVDITALFTQEI